MFYRSQGVSSVQSELGQDRAHHRQTADQTSAADDRVCHRDTVHPDHGVSAAHDRRAHGGQPQNGHLSDRLVGSLVFDT